MKYIFPKQFRLHNVFTSAVDPKETLQPLMDYTLREHEISQSVHQMNAARSCITDSEKRTYNKPRLPKRLRGLPVELVRKLQVQHSRCSYVQLLNHYCGTKVSLDCYA